MGIVYAKTSASQLQCPVCQATLEVRLARGRSSGKTFLMALCPRDGRHIRAFINDKKYVEEVLVRLEKNNSTEPEGNKQ